ncbi:hypothetical protein ACH4CE_37020 [Streptomyces gelaticus]|uniref:hypothetical protein n=1 Tax=Streptomyces gelaticus TaxID=285446 RepID=UPI00379CE33A
MHVRSPVADLRQDEFMTGAYGRALRTLGRNPESRAGEHIASTDMGNVSQVLPAIHPTIGYEVGDAVHHTAEFGGYGASPSADSAVLDGAAAMALVGAELARDPEQRARLLGCRFGGGSWCAGSGVGWGVVG